MWEKLALNYSKKKGGGIQSNNLCTWKLTPWVGSKGLANNLWWPSSHHEQEDENKIQNDFNQKKVMMMDSQSKELSPPQEHVLASMQQPKLQKQVFESFYWSHTITKSKLMVSLFFKPYSPKEKAITKYIHTYKKGPYPELVLYSTYNPLSFYVLYNECKHNILALGRQKFQQTIPIVQQQ